MTTENDGRETSPLPDAGEGAVRELHAGSGGAAQAPQRGDQGLQVPEALASDERAAPAPVTAPRVRAPGAGGFQVATSEGKGTPWWRLVGGNGEVLGHSEVYDSISNARRGVEAAERTVIQNAHRAGRTLYDVLREMDTQDALIEQGIPTPADEDYCGIPASLAEDLAGLTRDQLVAVAALAVLWADLPADDREAAQGGVSS